MDDGDFPHKGPLADTHEASDLEEAAGLIARASAEHSERMELLARTVARAAKAELRTFRGVIVQIAEEAVREAMLEAVRRIMLAFGETVEGGVERMYGKLKVVDGVQPVAEAAQPVADGTCKVDGCERPWAKRKGPYGHLCVRHAAEKKAAVRGNDTAGLLEDLEPVVHAPHYEGDE